MRKFKSFLCLILVAAMVTAMFPAGAIVYTDVPDADGSSVIEGSLRPEESETLPEMPGESDVPEVPEVLLERPEDTAEQMELTQTVSGTCGENLTWKLTTDGTLTISGTGAMTDYGYYYESPWPPYPLELHILERPWDEYRESIKKVVIGNGVTSIGLAAFYLHMSITSVTIGSSVTTIGDYAFSYCSSLPSITIPDSVTSIGRSAFSYCSSLPSITIPDSVTSIGGSAFFSCGSLTSVTIPEGVTSIGASAFYYCTSLTSITIPEGVTSIGASAFEYCTNLASITVNGDVEDCGRLFDGCTSLTKLVVGSGVTKLHPKFYEGNKNLATITVKSGNKHYSSKNGILYNKDKTTLIKSPQASALTEVTLPASVTTISEYAFSKCASLERVTLGSNVKEIGAYAFERCFNIAAVTLPDSLTTIGEYAFTQCSSLADITLPDSLTTIGEYAFSYCFGLTSIEIPAGVTTIGDYAFMQCIYMKNAVVNSHLGVGMFQDCGLETVTLGEKVTCISEEAFSSCDNLTSFVIPEGVTCIEERAFWRSERLESVTIPESVTTIGRYAFMECSALQSITIPAGVTTIEGYIFAGSGLRTLTVVGNVENVSEYAFRESYNLQTLVVGKGVTQLNPVFYLGAHYLGTITVESGNKYYSSQDGILYNKDKTILLRCPQGRGYNETFEIPNGVKELGEDAFYGTAFSYITIPDSVTSIGDYAFGQCNRLVTIQVPDSVTRLGEGAFVGCNWLQSIVLSENLTAIERSTFKWCESLWHVSIPDSVTSVGEYAFEFCEGLVSLYIGTSVETIGECAFEHCISLTYVDIPDSVKFMDYSAFKSCNSLKTVLIGDGLTSIGPGAFYLSDNIETVTIGKSVTSIEAAAFTVRDALRTVYYRGNKAQWDAIEIDDSNEAILNAEIIFIPEPGLGVPALSADNVLSSGKIKLSWNKVDGAEKYEVYRATSKNGTYKKLATMTKTNYTNTSVEPGVTYYYKVRAIAGDAKGDFSAIVSRTCNVAQVKGLTASNVASSGKIKLTWNKVDGATHYEVWRATSKDGRYTKFGPYKSTSFTNTSVEPGVTYYYRVHAIIDGKSSATGAYSEIVSRTCDVAQVTGLTATNVASSGKIKLTWNKVDGATHYEVWRATSKSGTYTKLYTASGTSMTNTGAKSGVTYYYKVRAIIDGKSSATGAYSEIVSRVCDLARPVLSIKLSSKGNPVLTWNAVSGAVQYEVYRSTSKNGTYTKLITTTNTKYINSSVEEGVTYYYKVKAISANSAANSAYSAVQSITAK